MVAERKRGLAWLWSKRGVRVLGVFFLLIAVLYLCRFPILRGLGNYLIAEDPPQHADACFVLGGASTDRGEEAAKLYYAGYADRFICTGRNVPGDLKELGIELSESDMTKRTLVRCGVPADHILSFKEGTSTQEEADHLLELAKAEHLDTVIIVSHGFHLRRVRNVFTERYAEAGITVLLHKAESTSFSHVTWWDSEQGMIMVQNEYAKLLYYAVKY